MSRFISAGADDASPPTERDEAWRKAQLELEAKKVQKAEADKQEGGKSLFETLEANKAAKQDAFEEANRLRNQFRSLDDDEIEFLDSVMESTRAKEADVRKETRGQLEAFRRQQEEAEKDAQLQPADEVVEGETVSWTTTGPRKRKKGREGGIGGVRLRRTSTNEKQGVASPVEGSGGGAKTSTPAKSNLPDDKAAIGSQGTEAASPDQGAVRKADDSANSPGKPLTSPPVRVSSPATRSVSPPAAGLGLAAYSSDEDD